MSEISQLLLVIVTVLMYIVLERIKLYQKKVRQQVLLIISMGASVTIISTKVTKH